MSSDLWAAFGGGESQDSPWASQSEKQEFQAKLAPTDLGSRSDPVESLGGSDRWQFSTSAPIPSQPSHADDEWSAFESAVPTSGTTKQDDVWSSFENAAPAVEANDTTVDEGGLFWDADSALQNQHLEPFTNSHGHDSLIDISSLGISDPGDEGDDFGDYQEAETTAAPTLSPMPATKARSQLKQTESMPPAKQDIYTSIIRNRIDTQGVGAASRLIFGAVKKGTATAETTSKPTTGPSNTLSTNSNTSAKSAARSQTKSAPKFSSATAADDDIDEAWDDFTSLPPDDPPPTISKKPIASSISVPEPSSEVPALPPSNVPPPSILLSLVHNTIIPAFSKPSPTIKSPNPSLRATAHILAGRKSRWKRDTHLAQSMSISASAPGLKSGMKLTGVDKAESTREDREAAELLRVFKQNAGALRAKALKSNEKGIVDLAKPLVIREEKAAGTVVGVKPCVICGLRRAERVSGVDVDVYDGFGEWWVEHWGHRECKAWWEENKGNLDQR